MARKGEIQFAIYNLIREYNAEHGKSPSLRMIMKILGIKSTAAVLFHIKSLESKELIEREKGVSNGIRVLQEVNQVVIPVLGIANASRPLGMAEEDDMGKITIHGKQLKNNGDLYAVKINGDSMNQMSVEGTLLAHGNYAVIDSSKKDPNTKDVILALVNGGATIKVFTEIKDGIVLVPKSDNPKHHPIYIYDSEQFNVLGKVVYALESPNID